MEHGSYAENWGFGEVNVGGSKNVEDFEGVQPPLTKQTFHIQAALQPHLSFFFNQKTVSTRVYNVHDRDENTLHFVCQVQNFYPNSIFISIKFLTCYPFKELILILSSLPYSAFLSSLFSPFQHLSAH